MSRLARAAKDKLAKNAELAQKRFKAAADSIANYLTGLGTAADSTLAGRPSGLDGRLSTFELASLYVTDDLARRIVEEPVEDATRGGWEVTDGGTGERLLFPPHLAVARKQYEAACWGRLFGRGALLMVPHGPYDLSLPRPPGDVGVMNLLPLGGDELSPSKYEGDARAEGFGRASHYNVTPNTPGGLGNLTMGSLTDVHESWLLIYGGYMLPPEFRSLMDDSDDSVLQAVWNVLRRFIQTEQALASIVTRFETSTISISGLNATLAAKDGTTLIQRRMGLFMQSLSMINAALIDADAGEKYERKYAQVSGLDTIWDRMAHSVAKASGIPMTQLFGMSPSGLGTDDKSGRANWRKRVAAYQQHWFAPNLAKLAAACGRDNVELEFPPLDEVTPEEKQIMDEMFARMCTQAIGSGWMTPEEARTMARRKGWPLYAALPTAAPGGAAPLATPAAVAQLPESAGLSNPQLFNQ